MRRVLSDGVIAIMTKIAAGGLGYLMFVLLARVMAPAEFGNMGFALNAALFLGVVASGGLHIAILRWIPEYRVQNNPELASSALFWSAKRTLLLSALVAIAALVGGLFWMGRSASNYLIIGVALIFPLALAEFVSSGLRAFGSITLALVPRDVVWRLIICFCAGLALMNGNAISSGNALLLQFVSLSAIVLLQLFLLLGANKREFGAPKSSDQNVREWSDTAAPIWLFSVVYAASVYIDVVILGLYLSPESTGPYFAAVRTASVLQLIHIGLSAVTAPMIAHHYHAGERAELQRRLRLIAALVGATTIVAYILLVVFGQQLLGLFHGDFVAAYPAMLILGLGYAIHAMSGPVGYLLLLSGHERDNLKIVAWGYGCGLIIQLLTIPVFGYTGAAIGSCIGIIGWNIWSRAVAIRKTGVDPTVLSVFTRAWRKPF